MQDTLHRGYGKLMMTSYIMSSYIFQKRLSILLIILTNCMILFDIKLRLNEGVCVIINFTNYNDKLHDFI